MAQQGFAEGQAAYDHAGSRDGVGDVPRFGTDGPAYEVVAIARNGDVEIRVVGSGELLTYSRAEFLADPVATTIP